MSRKYVRFAQRLLREPLWGTILVLAAICLLSVILTRSKAELINDDDMQLASLVDEIDQISEKVEEAVQAALDELDEIIQNELEDNRRLEKMIKSAVGKNVRKRQLRVARRYEESVDASKKPIVTINHSFGLLKVSPWNKQQVMVKALLLVSSSIDDSEAQQLADEIEIAIEGDENEIVIETKYPEYEKERGGYEVELSVTVPESSSLNTRNSFGSLAITGILGSVESDIRYGSALIQDCGDDLDMKGKYGSIAVLGIEGDVEISCEFGGVYVADVKGNQRVSNKFGEVNAQADPEGGDITLHNEFGKVELYVPQEIDAEVHASTEFGALKSDLPLDVERDGFKYYAEGYFGEQEFAEHRQIDLKNRFGEVKISDSIWDFELEQFWDRIETSPNIEGEIENSRQSRRREKMPYEETFSESVSLGDATSVQIEHSHGNVEVQGWDEPELKLDGEKIVRAKTEELAREYASQMKVEITREGDKIYVKTIRPELSFQESRRFKIKQMTINYTLMVPRQMDVDLKNKHGNAKVSSLEGELDVDSRHGNLNVENIGKDLSVKHEHGNIEVADVGGNATINKRHGQLKFAQVVGDLILEQQHGNADINNVGGKAEVNHQHGNLELISVGNDVQLRHRHGNVVLETIGGSVEANKEHGSLRLNDVQAHLTIKSKHSNIDASDIRGNAHIEARHGRIEIEGVGGDLFASDEHGNVSVGGISGAVTVRNAHGNINVTADEPIARDYTLSTRHANITIDLPKDSRVDIHANTSHGNISSAVPLEQIKSRNDATASGQLNGGGAKIELSNNFGNITIK